uniref:Membrane-spanning 4-domains subfamily A member 15-like n=2 Tax=Scleropages formosus TaxID=113540 RepID=A0A8C9RV61_SCLFO
MESVPYARSGTEDGEPRTTVIGLNKPLHRFIRGDPRSTGIVMLFLGGSQFLLGIPMKLDVLESAATYYTGFWLGIMFISSGILYILSDENTSKKLVTASLAVSIISIIGAFVAFVFFFVTSLRIHSFYSPYRFPIKSNMTDEDYAWKSNHTDQILCLQVLFLIYCVVGMVILIVMSAFSRAGLRSSRTQAIVVMHNRPTQ